jgi:cytochrome bd-type quinol oxidase subunit 2
MQLQTIWFITIAVFWLGFFVLDGFDFGVGALHMLIGKTETERRVVINTIGPWRDANEVWLVVARRVHVRGLPWLVPDLGEYGGAQATDIVWRGAGQWAV